MVEYEQQSRRVDDNRRSLANSESMVVLAVPTYRTRHKNAVLLYRHQKCEFADPGPKSIMQMYRGLPCV